MDYFRATAPAQTRPAGAFVSEIGFDKIDNLVNWKDISPRLGYGNPTEVFNGVDFSLNARLGSSGGLVAGGPSWGRVVVDNCFVVDSPQLVNCRLTNPPQVSGLATGGTQLKLQAIYPLPW